LIRGATNDCSNSATASLQLQVREERVVSGKPNAAYAPKKRDSDTELAFGLLFGSDHSSCMFNSTNVMNNKQIYGQQRGERSVLNRQKQAEGPDADENLANTSCDHLGRV
jgi:hypothetical protein